MPLPRLLPEATMRRRRLVFAGMVALAALGCLLPWREWVWLRVAYREVQLSEVPLVLRVKRARLLPGERIIVPDQKCIPCGLGDTQEMTAPEVGVTIVRWGHQCCSMGQLAESSDGIKLSLGSDGAFTTGDVAYLDKDWHCLCPTCYPERQ